jgi:16S rRNA (adenine1518-N6/adenine1519-N6)-dimethyltransferase
MDLFEEKGFHPRTDLGQNFLIDLNLIEFVVESAQLGPDDVVLEIGSGTGGMTTYLAQQSAEVISVEVDHRVFALAQEATQAYENVRLLNVDALKNKNHFAAPVLEAIEQALAVDPKRRLKLVSNLPYVIATPVVSNLVASDLPWTMMVVTIQLELGQRMQASPSTDDYSALSVWLQAQAKVKILKTLGPTVFWPRPNVDSAILRVTPEPKKREFIDDREFFHDFVRRLFHHRRKLLRSVLVGMYRKDLTKPQMDEVLAAANLPANARAEALDVQTLVALSNRVKQRIEQGERGASAP